MVEVSGHGKGDMLPGSIGKNIEAILYPAISGFLATRRTESGLAGMESFNTLSAEVTDKDMVSKKSGATDKEFEDIDDDTGSD